MNKNKHYLLGICVAYFSILALNHWWFKVIPTGDFLIIGLTLISVCVVTILKMKYQCPSCEKVIKRHEFKEDAFKSFSDKVHCPKCHQLVIPAVYNKNQQIKKRLKKTLMTGFSIVFLIMAFPPIVLMPMGLVVIYTSSASDDFHKGSQKLNEIYDQTREEGLKETLSGKIQNKIDTTSWVKVSSLKIQTPQKEKVGLILNRNVHSVEGLEKQLNTGLQVQCYNDLKTKSDEPIKICFPHSYMDNPEQFKQSNSKTEVIKTLFEQSLKSSILYPGSSWYKSL